MEDKKKEKQEKNTKTSAQFNILPNAEKGKVVTRFAPEPSGYLHIGHVKAAMLCYHLAKMYEGQMILRFDDTNPSKEKGEFEENIKKDLEALQIKADKVTYSSNYFPQLREYMLTMLKEGKAYCDNTDPALMKEERTNGVKSKNRDNSVEDNIKIWEQMCSENPSDEIKKYCVRGKIDYQNPNKCLRDPVFYRFSEDNHIRMPENYHLFPCYDFACPILDSIEGITHAMRANEYSDRIPMYEWVQEQFKLRKVTLYEFSRLNLIQTVLSKRYLKWFVETNRVEGWDDPRFPTVQGIVRRGLVPDALKDFCLEQGPSKKNNLMEWDKIYAINRNYIDPVAKRYFAVGSENYVNLIIDNMEDKVEEVMVPWHQKNKELGERVQNHYNKLIIEKEDAAMVEEGKKLTLYKWANSQVTKVVKDENGNVKEIHIKLTPEDKDFKKTQICHWIPFKEGLYTKVILVEYGHLINVKKFEDNMKIEDIVNNNSKFETPAFAESIILQAKKGDKIQFERRGYFIVDKLPENDKPMYLINIPDGKTKNISIIDKKVDAKTLNTGDKDDKKEAKNKAKKENREEKKKKKEEKKAKKAEEKAKHNEKKGDEKKEEVKKDDEKKEDVDKKAKALKNVLEFVKGLKDVPANIIDDIKTLTEQKEEVKTEEVKKEEVKTEEVKKEDEKKE